MHKTLAEPTPAPIPTADPADDYRLRTLHELARKVLWLASWTVHHANHVRPNLDGLKVGGHQASSASLATIMTALYFDVLRPEDRVAVKPHAAPVFHAIQYLLGRQTRGNLENFRAFGGAQSYPSRTKDTDEVDFSTGSVGLGVAMTVFASLVQDYVQLKGLAPTDQPPGRMVALVGDAELDEGNVFEALFEGWKHDLRNVWWVIDYNRQSLDSIVHDDLLERIAGTFATMGWRVVPLKYGQRLEAAFTQAGGVDLRTWIDTCPNSLYSALVYKATAGGWRVQLERDLGRLPGLRHILDGHDDRELDALLTNLAGHDLPTLLAAFRGVTDERPTCFIAYTVKGYGLPFAGHRDNHAGMMSSEQVELLRQEMKVASGEEWERFAGLALPAEELARFLEEEVPFVRGRVHTHETPAVAVPPIPVPAAAGRPMSTQQGFGRILGDLAGGDSELATRLVTTSPDVTVSTNLGGWVNRRGLFHRREVADVFREERILSPQRWVMSPTGQHLELGIAEHNLFLLLGALGLAGPLFGARLLPVGTVYDPFILRGLDALNYACYQDARFLLVATPSGLTLAPEGGAHQSVLTPLVGMGQDRLAYYEPAYVDELAVLMAWAFGYLQAPGDSGGSVYLRLSTLPLPQPERTLDEEWREGVVGGAYWAVPPAPGAKLAIVYVGAVAGEALAAHAALADDIPGAGLLAVTSPDRLHAGWTAAGRRPGGGGRNPGAPSRIERLLAPLAANAVLVTVLDGHPATLSWLGAVGAGRRVQALGVERFGQSGNVPELYRAYGLDADAILDAVARTSLERRAEG